MKPLLIAAVLVVAGCCTNAPKQKLVTQKPHQLYGGKWVPCETLHGMMPGAECRDVGDGINIEVRKKAQP